MKRHLREKQPILRVSYLAIPLLLIVAVSVGCSKPPGASETAPAGTTDDGFVEEVFTSVAILGMTHSGHLTSSLWGLDQVRETIRRIDPDVVCAEIPPDRWERIWSDYSERGVIEDARVKRFPEYTEVLLPLTREMDFVIEPCAAWTEEMADERRARLEALETDESLAELAAEYERRNAEVELRHAESPIDEDDPHVIHSPLYDERTRESLAPYDELLNDYIGAGGWQNINASHWVLVEKAIAKHPGKRILITFGAGHKGWFLDVLSRRRDLQRFSILDDLPPKSASEEAEADAQEPQH